MAKFDRQTGTARRLIEKNGAKATLRRVTTTMRNPITQTGGATSTLSAEVVMVGLPAGKSAEYAVGTLAKRNVLTLYIAHDRAYTPQPGDVVTWGGHEWKLIWSATYDPAADGAIFTQAYAER